MDILELIKDDHAQAKALLDGILEAKRNAKRRSSLFKHFKTVMTAHSRAEEAVLYHRLEKAKDAKDDALEGAVEHHLVDILLAELGGGRDKSGDKWEARCRVLKEMLEHHMAEEEDAIFALARKLFDAAMLERMGTEFAQEKERHGAPVKEHVGPLPGRGILRVLVSS